MRNEKRGNGAGGRAGAGLAWGCRSSQLRKPCSARDDAADIRARWASRTRG